MSTDELLAEALRLTRVDSARVAEELLSSNEVRPAESKFYAFLNDENRAPSTTIVDALQNYDIGARGTTSAKNWLPDSWGG
jgi:hypothetical protein